MKMASFIRRISAFSVAAASALLAGLAAHGAWAAPADTARPDDVAGFSTARWGMDDSALDAAFGDALARLPGRRDYGGAYATRFLARTELGGAAFRAFFQMNAGDGTLQQVLLEPILRGRQLDAFRAARDALHARWGPPDARCVTSRADGGPFSLELVWRFATTTAHVGYIDFLSPDIIYEDERVGREYARERDIEERRTPRALDEPVRGADPQTLPRTALVRFHATAHSELASPACTAGG